MGNPANHEELIVHSVRMAECADRFLSEEKKAETLLYQIRKARSLAEQSSPETLEEYRRLIAWTQALCTYFHGAYVCSRDLVDDVIHTVNKNRDTIQVGIDSVRESRKYLFE